MDYFVSAFRIYWIDHLSIGRKKEVRIMGRIGFILVLVIDVLAILDVWKRESSNEKKLLWTVIILLLPLLGPIAWYVVSRRIINL